VVLRTRPDWVDDWTNEDVARRWLQVFPQPQVGNDNHISLLAKNSDRMAELRARLSSVSWFMRCLNEYVARRANSEDGCRGRFWEGRFKCQVLLDESAVLACMAYVDLNPVRAGVAKTPEESEYTSIYERLQREQGGGRRHGPDWLCPIDAETLVDGREGILPISLREYLDLVDWTGRTIRQDKPGAIPADLVPILERLEVNYNRWLTTVQGYGGLFHRAVGRASTLLRAARKEGKRWLSGISAGKYAFSTA
jgi:hypothetical protein